LVGFALLWIESTSDESRSAELEDINSRSMLDALLSYIMNYEGNVCVMCMRSPRNSACVDYVDWNGDII